MKILIISSIFPPHIFGGAEVAAYNMARLLVARGHDVHVATTAEQDEGPAWGQIMPEGYRLYRLAVPRKHTLYGRHERGGGAAQKLIWHAQDYFDMRNLAIMRKLLDDVCPDHIDIHNIMGIGFNTLPLIGDGRASVAYILHDLGLACFRTSMFKNGVNCASQCSGCRVSSWLRLSQLNQVKRLSFISPSKASLEKLSAYVPILASTPKLVLHNVQEEHEVESVERKNPKPHFLYVGRLDPVKGIDFLLSVLDKVSKDYQFHFTVLGTGPLEQSLREKYIDASWVEFKGFVSGEEVARSVSNCDVYCIPSLWSETYGMTTALALKNGIPVIGSALGGTLELVDDGVTGLLLPVGSEEAWINAFSQLLANPELLQSWKRNALESSDQFSANKIAQKYENFIQAL